MNFKNKRTCTFGTDTETSKTVGSPDIKAAMGEIFSPRQFIQHRNVNSPVLYEIDEEYEYHSIFMEQLQPDMILLNKATSKTLFNKDMFVEDMIYYTYNELLESVLKKHKHLSESDIYLHYGNAIINRVNVNELDGFDLVSLSDWRYQVTIMFDVTVRKPRTTPLRNISKNKNITSTELYDISLESKLVEYAKKTFDINLDIITEEHGRSIDVQNDKSLVNIHKGILSNYSFGGHTFIITRDLPINEIFKLVISENVSPDYKEYYLYFRKSSSEILYKGETFFITPKTNILGGGLIDEDELAQITIEADKTVNTIRYVLLAKV